MLENTVQFTKADGSLFESIFRSNAATEFILVFPTCADGEHSLPCSFPLASFGGTFEETLGDQKAGVESIIRKLNLKSTLPEDVQSWDEFWAACPRGDSPSISLSSPFKLPQTLPPERRTNLASRKRKVSTLDDGNRDVDVVCHEKITARDRAVAIREVRAFREGHRVAQNETFSGGDIVLVVDPDLKANTNAYMLPFLLLKSSILMLHKWIQTAREMNSWF